MIGILPAAGSATRIHGLPKYLLPVPGGYLLERQEKAMSMAATFEVIACSDDNFDLICNHSDNAEIYSVGITKTMTETLLIVSSFIDRPESDFLFGMPDTYIEDGYVYDKLYKRLQTCDVAIAVFRARPGQHAHGGMVRFSHNRVTEVIDKPAETNLQYIWGALAWKPAFWDCLTPDMPHVGYGLPVAIERGLDVRAVICDGGFWDCGTPDEYFECIRTLTRESVHAS